MSISLSKLDSFGAVAAEDDDILLEYFLSTDAVRSVEDGDAFLVLGRKGAGKTAIVRHFTEGENQPRSRALNLRNYPWNVHARRVDRGSDTVDAYVASWRYLVAVELASWVINRTQGRHHDEKKNLEDFLSANYGGLSPKLSEIIRPKSLKVRAFSIMPQVLGNALGSVDLDRNSDDTDLGLELDALTNAILHDAIRAMKDLHIGDFLLHFDELDAGLETLDETRKQMIIGLVLALRGLRREFREQSAPVKPILYLRTDIWDDLIFSDKNKITQGQSVLIEWSADSLKDLVEERLQTKLHSSVRWDDIVDDQLMRGSQPKWNHIVARTLKRPRDIIHFLNVSLKTAKSRGEEPIRFSNRDIVDSRTEYSAYLKRELDDEITPHWKNWEQALQTLSRIATETFKLEDFVEEYERSKTEENQVSAHEALKLLHTFSVIGYNTRSGYGGSSWVFMYEEPDKGWDAHATRFKVHPGLKEHAGLREERV